MVRTPVQAGLDPDPLRAFAAAFLAVLSERTPVSAPLMSQTSETLAAYVAKAEALAITGLSADELRKAVRAGEVTVRGRRYRVKDLEAL